MAVLIDAENISYRYAKIILDEASNYGPLIYKRIYGDWSSPTMAPWRNLILNYSIQPIQKYFKAAEKYFREHGDLLVSSEYQTEDGLKFGIWIIKQRNKRNRRVKEHLTDEQIQRLDSIHMQWDGALHQQWMTYYLAAKDYYCNNGNLQIAKQYKTTSGLNLGTWITTQRANRKKSTADRQFISSQRIELLNEIGMRW